MAEPEDPQWTLIESRLLGGRVLIVYERAGFAPARSAHPDVPIYFPVELDALAGQREALDAGGFADLLRAVHVAKRVLGAWIVPNVKSVSVSPETPSK